MGSTQLVRICLVVLAAVGALLAWSSQPYFDLDAWRAAQVAATSEVTQPPIQQPPQQLEPVPSLTPTPNTVPQPDPTQTATPTPSEFGLMAVDCDTARAGVQNNCAYGATEQYTLQVHISDQPADGYYGFETLLEWTGTTAYLPAADAATEALWPECSLPIRSIGQPEAPFVGFACVPFPTLGEGSAHAGAVLQFDMACQSDGKSRFQLEPIVDAAGAGSYLLGPDGAVRIPALAGASVTCGAGELPASTPIATASPTPTPPVDTPLLPPSDRPARPGTTIEKDIELSGGRIDSPDDRVSIEFPPEAVSERLRVRITHKDLTDFPSIPGHPFMTGWEFEAFALDRELAEVEQFPADLRITVNYSETDLLGRNPDSLRMWTWNEGALSWEPLPSERVPHTGAMVLDVDHFSIDVATADPSVLSPAYVRAFQTNLQTGASQASIPIELPPGRGGLTPSLTLTYSSDRVNEMKSELAQGSWTGIGWDLSTGAIRAVYPDSLTQEDQNEPVRYFLSFAGAADELIKGSDGKWRTKRNQFLTIDRVGGSQCHLIIAGGTPCHWVVTDHDGTKHYFGATDQGPDAESARYYDYLWAQPDDQFHLYYYQWDLRQATDTHGNDIHFRYSPETLDDCPDESRPNYCQPWTFASYPDRIEYNWNASETVPATVVKFNLRTEDVHTGYPDIELRPDAPRNVEPYPEPGGHPDWRCGGYAIGAVGMKVEEIRVLESIEVEAFNGSGLTRRYGLTYSDTPFSTPNYPVCFESGETRLETFEVQGNTGTALHTMTFDYTAKTFDYDTESISQPFLTEATNGFGGTSTYQYVEKAATYTGDWWSRFVVSQLRMDGGAGKTAQVIDYTYTGGLTYELRPGFLDNELAEFRGFTKVTEERDTNILVDHEYFTTAANGTTNDEDPLSGREKTTTFREGSNIWRVIDYSYSTLTQNCVSTEECSRFIRLDHIETTEGAPPGIPIRTEYDYHPTHGNVTYERQLGTWVGDKDNRTIVRTYSTSSGGLVVLSEEKIYPGTWSSTNPPTSAPLTATTFFYDDRTEIGLPLTNPIGELTAVERSDGTGVKTGLHSTVYFGYDQFGNKTAESVPTESWRKPGIGGLPASDELTTWCYGSSTSDPCWSGNVYNETLLLYPKTVTNPMGHVTSLTWDLRMGLLSTRTEPTGNVVNHTYDVFGRLTSVDDSVSACPYLSYVYSWNRQLQGDGTPPSNPALNSTLTIQRMSCATGDDFYRSSCVDGFGRELQTRQGLRLETDPVPQVIESVVETGYNRRGLPSYVSQPFEDAENGFGWCEFGDIVGAPANGRGTSYTYNPLDEVHIEFVNPTLPSAACRSTERSGLTMNVTDENGHQTAYDYDGRGRLVTVKEYTGADSNVCDGTPGTFQLYATTNYDYDAADSLTLVTDTKGNKTRMAYDALGRKIDMTDPDMGFWTYGYDAAGNLTQQIDARCQAVVMQYDALNRLTQKSYDDASGDCTTPGPITVNAAYHYDSYLGGGCSGSTAVGRLTQMDDAPGIVHWCYDERGRELREERTIGTDTFVVSRTYDDADQLLTIKYPDLEVVTHHYDDVSGLPNGLTSGGTTYVDSANTTYNAALQITQLQLGTGFTTVYTYDERGRLDTLVTPKPGVGDAQNLDYDYDAVGNVTEIVDSTVPETANFQYDELDRLAKVTNAYTAAYAYDEIGNLTHIQEGNLDLYPKYDPRRRPHAAILADDSAIVSETSIVRAYDYDENGNLIGVEEGPSAQLVDSDGDGCRNNQERTTPVDESGAPDGSECGHHDPANFWDFPDTDGGGSIDVPNDITPRIMRWQMSDDDGKAQVNRSSDPLNTPIQVPLDYHPLYDLGQPDGPFAWTRAPADGRFDTPNDVTPVIAQWQYTSGPAPTAFSQQYFYDEENRLERRGALSSAIFVEYAYDGVGGLASRHSGFGASVVDAVYIANVYERHETSTASSELSYYWFNGRRIAMRVDGTLTYLLGDHLGSTTAQVDTTGEFVSGSPQTYYPYGTTRSGGVSTDKQFTGHQKEGDLYFMQARFYMPEVGRFTQPDTIVPDPMDPQSLNRYSYVYNNPLRYTDPTGRAGVVPPTSSGCLYTPCPEDGEDDDSPPPISNPDPPRSGRTPPPPLSPPPPTQQPAWTAPFTVYGGSGAGAISYFSVCDDAPSGGIGVIGACSPIFVTLLDFDVQLLLWDELAQGYLTRLTANVDIRVENPMGVFGAGNLLSAELRWGAFRGVKQPIQFSGASFGCSGCGPVESFSVQLEALAPLEVANYVETLSLQAVFQGQNVTEYRVVIELPEIVLRQAR